MHFSLIIPARNEAAYLPRLLDTVEAARSRYRGSPSDIEVIVVDNGSTDGTPQIARSRGFRVLSESKRIIAAVRNRGARHAGGDILAFTDADNRIHPHTFNVIRHALELGNVVAGATGVTLDRMSPGIGAAYICLMPLVWVTRMDTGVVFCRKADFQSIGGYNESRLFGEDVQLLWDLRRLGKSRGQRLIRLTSVKAVTSTRKFDRFGEWHYLGLMVRGLLGLLVPGYSLERLAQRYWYSDDRD